MNSVGSIGDAQPLSDLGDFAVDFPTDAPMDRPTHDFSGVQVERTVQSPDGIGRDTFWFSRLCRLLMWRSPAGSSPLQRSG